MMNQKDAVFVAVVAVLEREPNRGERVLQTMSKDQIKLVNETVIGMFLRGEVSLRDETKRDETYIRGYVPGMVNNWMRKDTRINGGDKYETQKPGSRAGAGNPTLTNLKNLLAATKDPDAKALVQAEITKVEAEIAKAKVKLIDASKIPAHLLHLIPAA